MRIRLLAFFLTVVLLPLSFGLAQTAAGLDSIQARMHDAIVANEVSGVVTVVATRNLRGQVRRNRPEHGPS
jgi:hypothetical protein